MGSDRFGSYCLRSNETKMQRENDRLPGFRDCITTGRWLGALFSRVGNRVWRNETNYTTDKIPRTRVPFVGTLTLVSRNLKVGSFGLLSLLAFFLGVTFAHNTLTIQRKRKLIQSITTGNLNSCVLRRLKKKKVYIQERN